MAITISDTEPRVQYTATSGQTSFSVPFEFFTVSDIKVFNGNTQLSFNASPSSASQYSVTGAAVSGGGSITLGGGATLNDVITIFRDLAVARSTDFPTSGAFQIDSLNTELDKIIAMIQQVERDLKFSPKAAATTANTFNLTFPNLVANKFLTVNPGGTALEFTQDVTNVNTVAGISSNIVSVSNIAANVTTVAGVNAAVTTVANNIGSVNTVAADITKVIAVANDLAEAVSEVETVADDLNETTSEIEVVAGAITNVNNVGNSITNVNSVAGALTNINNLNATNVISHIGTVAGIAANVTSVAGVASNVTTVAGMSTAINTINSSAAAINAVNSNATNINAVNSNSANINTVAGISSQVTSVGNAVSAINTVNSNLAAVQNFADVYRISSSAPSSSLNVGDLYFDTTANELKVYKSSGWAAAGSTVNGTANRFIYNITGTPSTLSGASGTGYSEVSSKTLAYDSGFIDIFLNGVKQILGTDVTATSGNSVVFASALAAGDVVDIVGYGTFELANISINDLTDTPSSIGSAGQALVVNGAGNALTYSNASSAEVYGFERYFNPSTLVKTVTVVSVGGSNKYFIDGIQQDTLNLYEGNTYIFNYPSAHPFKFSTTSNGTHGSGSEYTTGVTHNSSTQVTIVVASGAPTLYYYCSSHSNMGGTANTPTPGNNSLRYITTNQGADNISESQYANFDDVLFSASGFVFSINSNGNLISTI